MLTLALALALAQTPQHRLFMQPNLPRASYAFFEFAPESGAGMPAVCSSTAPTGAKGETLTFTRATTATCTKTASGGLATTGIANGDLVSMASGVARVEYDSNGVKGLLVEEARTNYVVRSEEIDNASWTKEGNPSAPTVTANYATAPDGTATADRLQPVATTGVQYSDIYQLWTASAAGDSVTCSGYVKGNASADTTDICVYNGAAWSCADCAYVTGSWNRCSKSATGSGTTTRYCKIGNNSNQNGGVARNAGDISVWGLQGESGAFVTSYIPTTSAAATRNAEVASFAISFNTASGYSVAASNVSLQSNGGGVWAPVASLYQDASNRTQMYRANTNGFTADYISTSGSRSNAAPPTVGPYSAGQQYRFASSLTPGASSTLSNYLDGVLVETSAAGATSGFTATSLFLPGLTSGTATDTNIISRVCVDPSPTRCR